MPRTEPTELTVLCLIQQGDKILLQNRTKADWRGYALPGGHVEPGESFVDAVVREMQEETGLTIRNPQLVGVKQFPLEGGRYVVFLFKATQFTGELTSSAEGEVGWFSYAELPGLHTVADLQTLLDVMNNPLLTEFQYVVTDNQWTATVK
ncbi:MAG: 8-oxo-dGTP diphosphatase [Ruminococcaceae bacterium]|nr:8-oxo-dGTP diphosphatase [Oscillospiraceae bacterium]